MPSCDPYHLDVSHNVLAHHDCVVDQNSDRQRETDSDIVLSVNPNAHTAMNDASTETGSASR